MGFQKNGLVKAIVAFSTLCSAYFLINWIKHQPKPEEVVKTPLSPKAAFFQDIKQKPKVKELIPFALYVEKVKKGSGPRLSEYDVATIHVKGRNLEREPIINTFPNEPIKQMVITTIDGFREGILGMRSGERRILYIDPSLETKKFNIKNQSSPLIYEVELVSFDKTQD